MKIFQEKLKIISNSKLKDSHNKIILNGGNLVKIAQPGQFIEIKINNTTEPLLRRPFSIHRAGNSLEILYEIKGKGTEELSYKKPGESLDVIGPLGNGFDFRKPITVNRQPILVAGGMGVAPLLFLADKLAFCKPITDNHKPIILIGAKTKKQILCEKEFKQLGFDVKIATDDGSCGFKGRVTGLLKDLLLAENLQPLTVFSCGPKPMLKELSRIASLHYIPAQVSLEEHMACGIGACLGCVVKTVDGYQRVCKDGPVFDAQEIIW
jgi:dihydroorotate dehydrogenase electron transfer subunit